MVTQNSLATEVHVLASGSKGNCTLIRRGESFILHDAGISCRRIVNGVKELGLEMHNLEGVFISHEHSDHIGGLQQLLKLIYEEFFQFMFKMNYLKAAL